MSKKKSHYSRAGLVFEELEPRLLLSADPLAVATDADGASVQELILENDEDHTAIVQSSDDQSFSSVRNELVIIDSRAPNYQQLHNDLIKAQQQGRNIHVVVLDAHRDGIDQISEAMVSYDNLDAVHIVSHGDDAQLQLGAIQLNKATLLERSGDIRQWKDAFTESGDLLIYGCNLAETAEGKTLIGALSYLTETDVAASDDLTGNQLLGGDWELEYEAGEIETDIAFSEQVQDDWQGTLEGTSATAEEQTTAEEQKQQDLQAQAELEAHQAALAEEDQATTEHADAEHQAAIAEEQRQELVFIDDSVTDYQTFLDDLQANSSTTNFEIVLLDGNSNGIERINEILSAYRDIDALHILSHGDDGAVKLGNTWLHAESLDEYGDSLNAWSDALDQNADILIYGCNLAESADGKQFVNELAQLTGADVAASDDNTGHAALSGDWDLEYRHGDIETPVAISDGLQETWVGVLASFNVDTNADTADANPGDGLAQDASGNTSLRAAIEEANALGGSHTITLDADTYTLSAGELLITSDITVTGVGADQTYIDGNALSRVLHTQGGVTVTITDVTIQNGDASGGGNGGALWIDDATDNVTLERVRLIANTADTGGAIYNQGGTLTFTDGEISGNFAIGGGQSGGGLDNEGTAILERVTISGNTAGTGGGIYNGSATASLTMTNVTISGNTGTANGGGLFTTNTAVLTNVTITANTTGNATGGSGIHRSGGSGSVDLRNTIVAANTGSPDLLGSFNSLGNNLIGDSGGVSGFTDGVNGDQVGTSGSPLDPLLDPLADNGGFAQSHALQTGSTAINAGTSTGAPGTDQRGIARDDGFIDIGAYEFSTNAAPVIWDYHHTIDLAAATAVADYPVKIELIEGVNGFNHANVQANGEDIRLYDSAGNELSYWIEDWNNAGTSTIWVKVASAGTSTIELFYANTDAASASDATATFLFYDDFEDGDAAGWTAVGGATSGTAPNVLNDGGNLVYSDGANSGGPVVSGGSWSDVVVSQDFRTINAGDPIDHAGLIARYEDASNMVYGGIITSDTAQIWYREAGTWFQIGGDWSITARNVDDGNWHNQELRVYGDTVELYIDDIFIGSASVAGTGSAAGTSGQTGFWSQYGNYEAYRDNHIVRSYDAGTGDIATTAANQGYAIDENTASATLVGKVLATDPDVADVLVYSITAGNTDNAFAINSKGQITANNSAALDYETNPVFNLTVLVQDGNGGEDTHVITVTLNDISSSLVVTTTAVTNDGDVSSAEALNASKGADGHISLYEAIQAANNSSEDVTISFDIAEPLVGGAHTITVGAGGLPGIADTVIIDATTDPDYAGDPVIRIDGSAAGAGVNGLTFMSTSDGSVVRGLMITNFPGYGIQVDAGADGITIANNWIGTTGTGSTGVGNSNSGINIQGASTIVGGAGANDGNVITNNGNEGINVTGAGATGTIIQGNIIGLDPDGSTGSGNTDVGIALLVGAHNTTIGGPTAAERNIISNNFEGIEINSNNNTVQGNYIGTDISGTLDRGNRSDDGVEVQNNTTGNLIGGTDPGAGNLIAFNARDGVYLVNGTGNSVLGNIIHSNSGLGIDLAANGVTTNDAGDADSGPNALQNFPVITGATLSGTDLKLSGTLETDGLTTQYRIEFYGNAAGTQDATHGEGRVYLGSTVVTTDGSGDAGFSNVTLSGVSLSVGDYVTATATRITDPAQVGVDDQLAYGSTSEFAANFAITASNTAPVATANTVMTTEDNAFSFSAADFTYTDVEGDPLVSATITNLALAGGTLTHSGGTAVSNGDTLTAAQLDTLVYTPSINVNGTPLATFDFSVNDADAGITTAQMSIDVTPVNDVPVANNNTVVTAEDVPYNFSAADFTFSDVEGDSLVAARITNLNLMGGTLTYSGGTAVVGGNTLTAAQLDTLVYTPAANANGSPLATFDFTVNDADLGTVTAQMRINVTVANDAPAARDDRIGLVFDGVDDYVTIGDYAGLNVSTNVTMEAWIRPTGLGTGTNIIVNKEGEYEMAINATTGEVMWAFDNVDPDWGWHYTGYYVQPNEWTHLAVTYDNGVVNTYANGVLVDTYNGSGAIGDNYPTFNQLMIGGRENAVTQRFDGQIDEVRIWNTTRTQLEIQSNMGSLLTGMEAGLIGNWRFDEGSGFTLQDRSVFGHHGTLADGIDVAEMPAWQGYLISEEGTLNVTAVNGVLANDFDIDGDPLTASLVSGPANAAAFTLNPDGSFSYTPAADFNGIDTFTYRANDGTVDSNIATVTIRVYPVNDVPVATANTVTTNEDTAYNFNSGDFTYTDVEGDALISATITNLSLAGGTLTHSGGTAVNIGDTLTAVQLDTLVYTPPLHMTGSPLATFDFTVNDAGSGVVSAQMSINVTAVNDVPVATANTVTTNEDTAYNFDSGDFTYTDTEGDALVSATITNLALAGGTLTHSGGTTVNSGDTLTAAELDTLIYTPAANANGTPLATFDFTVNDAGAGVVSAQMSIHVTAQPDAAVIGGIDNGVVTEDVDPNMNNLLEVSGSLTIIDPDAGEASFNAGAIGGTYGVITLNATGDWSYAAINSQAPIQALAAGATLTDTITIASVDGSTHDIVITIMGTNDAPLAGNDVATVNEGSSVIIDVAATDSDIDSALDLNSIVITSLPINGNVVVNGDGTVTYTHNGSETLADSFSYTISDISGAVSNTATVTLNVNPVNDPPAAGDDSATVVEGNSVLIDLAANDNDVDNALDPNSITIVTAPLNGSLAVNADGTVNYTHDGSETLSDSFTYTIADVSGDISNTATVSISVTAVNDVPTTSGIADVTVNEDDAPTTLDLNAAFDDIDNPDSELTYTIAGNSNIGLFSVATIDSSTGQLTLEYAADMNGSAQISIRASDPSGASVDTLFTVTVVPVNDNPVLQANTGLMTTATAPATISSGELNVTDIDNTDSELVYTITALPANGELLLNDVVMVVNDSFTQADLDSNRVVYRPTAAVVADQFGFTVSDSAGGSLANNTFEILVQLSQDKDGEPVNEPPPDSVEEETPQQETSEADSAGFTDGAGGYGGDFEPLGSSSVPPVAAPEPVLSIDPVPQPDPPRQVDPVEHEEVQVAEVEDYKVSTFSTVQVKSMHALWSAIDSMKQEMAAAAEKQTTAVEIKVAAAETSGVVLTAGVVAWILRSGALFSSLISTIPLWKGYDPLPILAYSDDDDDNREEQFDENKIPTSMDDLKKLKKLIKDKHQTENEIDVDSMFGGTITRE